MKSNAIRVILRERRQRRPRVQLTGRSDRIQQPRRLRQTTRRVPEKKNRKKKSNVRSKEFKWLPVHLRNDAMQAPHSALPFRDDFRPLRQTCLLHPVVAQLPFGQQEVRRRDVVVFVFVERSDATKNDR